MKKKIKNTLIKNNINLKTALSKLERNESKYSVMSKIIIN